MKNVRISNEKPSCKFKQNFCYPITKQHLDLLGNLAHEKRRMISKPRSGFGLSLANRTCGRTAEVFC